MVMSVTSQRIVAQIVPLGMALASPLALLCVPDSLMAQAVELLQGRFGGNEIELIAGGAVLVVEPPVFLASNLLGWWLIRRVVSWEVAKRSLLGKDGKSAPLYIPIVRWYEANGRDSGTRAIAGEGIATGVATDGSP
jgi:hypothetical protein